MPDLPMKKAVFTIPGVNSFPQFLKESDVQERMAGIQFGLSLLKECREVWVFGEVMSEGMCMEIAEADHAGIPIRYFTKQNGEFVERSSL